MSQVTVNPNGGLTDKQSPAKLPGNETIEQLQSAVEAGKTRKFAADMRRGLLTQVAAIEDFLGIDSRTCKHCGRPVR